MNHAFVDRGKNINGAVGLYKKIINENGCSDDNIIELKANPSDRIILFLLIILKIVWIDLNIF